MEDSTYTIHVELGAMQNVPAYEEHKRGRNWCAIISKDPTAPGGLARKFLQTARGEYFYMVGDLKRGDAVEFGADYYSGGGKPYRKRVYMVVESVSDEKIIFTEYLTANDAIKAAKAME